MVGICRPLYRDYEAGIPHTLDTVSAARVGAGYRETAENQTPVYLRARTIAHSMILMTDSESDHLEEYKRDSTRRC